MTHSTSTTWINNMRFESAIDSQKITLDAITDNEGNNAGVSPKKLLLTSLSGCSGMDVVGILIKMKHTPKHFNIKVNAELSAEHPKYYKEIHLIYEFGKSVPKDKAKKAIDLSLEKYCGVNQILKQLAKVSYEIKFVE